MQILIIRPFSFDSLKKSSILNPIKKRIATKQKF